MKTKHGLLEVVLFQLYLEPKKLYYVLNSFCMAAIAMRAAVQRLRISTVHSTVILVYFPDYKKALELDPSQSMARHAVMVNIIVLKPVANLQ